MIGLADLRGGPLGGSPAGSRAEGVVVEGQGIIDGGIYPHQLLHEQRRLLVAARRLAR